MFFFFFWFQHLYFCSVSPEGPGGVEQSRAHKTTKCVENVEIKFRRNLSIAIFIIAILAGLRNASIH